MRFRRFHEAYLQNLDEVYRRPQFVNSPRGFRSREILNCHFTLADPRERVCYLPTRKTNIVFNFAEVLWYLSGDDTLEFIAYYAKSMPKYSMNGVTLTGSAYGPKIFSFGAERVDQWQGVVDLLGREDPASKRAVISIFDPNESRVRDNLDVSCTLGLQFLARDGRLHMVTYMRANDAFRGILSDVFSFTFIQELLANQLGLELGEYHHNVGSMHIYDSDHAWATKVLEEAATEGAAPRAAEAVFPPMPPGDNWGALRGVFELERRLRVDDLRLTPELARRSGLPPYWQQIVLLLGVYQGVVRRGELDEELLRELAPVYRSFVVEKWGHMRSPAPRMGAAP